MLLRIVPEHLLLAQLVRDTRNVGPLSASAALAVWATWGDGIAIRRLILAAFCAVWTFISWHVAMRLLHVRVAGVGYTPSILSTLGWAMAGLCVIRWYTGVVVAGTHELKRRPVAPWQFQIRHLLLWTAALAATLACAQLAIPPEPSEHTTSLLEYYSRIDTQLSLALQCLITLSIAVPVAFRLRWLPVAMVLAIAAIGLSVLFDHWRGNSPLTVSGLTSTIKSTVRMNAAWITAAMPLLLTMRVLGYRLHWPGLSDAGSPVVMDAM